MTTADALAAVAAERERQKAAGTDGALTSRNDLIACALAYLGRAAAGVLRNEREGHDPAEMLVKAAAVLVDAVEREGDR